MNIEVLFCLPQVELPQVAPAPGRGSPKFPDSGPCPGQPAPGEVPGSGPGSGLLAVRARSGPREIGWEGAADANLHVSANVLPVPPPPRGSPAAPWPRWMAPRAAPGPSEGPTPRPHPAEPGPTRQPPPPRLRPAGSEGLASDPRTLTLGGKKKKKKKKRRSGRLAGPELRSELVPPLERPAPAGGAGARLRSGVCVVPAKTPPGRDAGQGFVGVPGPGPRGAGEVRGY